MNNALVVFEQSGRGEYSGVMSGSGILMKQGAGPLVLNGLNTYSGGTIVAAGSLQGTTRSLQGDILNLASLIFDQADSGTYAGSLFGTGSTLLRGGGRFELTGNSGAFTGDTTVTGSQLFVNGWLGGGHLQMQGGSLVGGTGSSRG